jgi:hypothetical protein
VVDEQPAQIAGEGLWIRARYPSRGPTLMVRVIEKPLHPGWVYPCTVEEIEQQLVTFPPEDLNGLSVICLAPVLRRDLEDRGVDGRYCRGTKPTIYLFGWPESFAYKFPKGTKRHHLAHLDVERSFGMRVEQVGRRWYCRWDPEDWSRFIREYVLAHEIGHHVCGPSEEAAHDYAMRYLQGRKGGQNELASHEKQSSANG